jgi:hypothetical protein
MNLTTDHFQEEDEVKSRKTSVDDLESGLHNVDLNSTRCQSQMSSPTLRQNKLERLSRASSFGLVKRPGADPKG